MKNRSCVCSSEPTDTYCIRPESVNDRLKEFMALLSFLHLQNGKSSKAVTLLEGLQSLAGVDDWSLSALAYAQELVGNHEAVLRTLRRLPKAKRMSVSMQLIEARALWGLGRRREAKSIVGQFTSDSTIARQLEIPGQPKPQPKSAKQRTNGPLS